MDSSIRQPSDRAPRSGERRRRKAFVVCASAGRASTGAAAARDGSTRAACSSCATRPPALLVLLASVNVMNLLDQLATTRALAAGLHRGQPRDGGAASRPTPAWPPRSRSRRSSPSPSAVWTLRRYRAILQVAVFMFVVFAAVLLVHFYGAALYY